MENKHTGSKILYIAAGFLAGILVLGILFYISSVMNKPKDESKNTNQSGFTLNLTDAPDDGYSTSQNKVTIAGSTGTEAVVVVNGGPIDETVPTSNGNFSLSYTLSEGENQLTITAFDQKTGESKTTTRSVLYLPNLESL
jgi:hypothetical protein